MKWIERTIDRLSERHGQDMIEYALLSGVIAVALRCGVAGN